MVNQRTSRQTYLYVMGAPGSTTVKIGMTIDLEDRCRQIQRMSPVKIEVLWARPAPYTLERSLHRHFAAHRSHGEWFTFNEDPLPLIKAAVAEGLEDAQEAARSAVTPPPAEDEEGMSFMCRFLLDELRRVCPYGWFTIADTAEQVRCMEASMRDSLDVLVSLGKVVVGPERLDWRKRQYSLVVGTRS